MSIIPHNVYETLASAYGRGVQVHVSPKFTSEAIEGSNRKVVPKNTRPTTEVPVRPHNFDQDLVGERDSEISLEHKDSKETAATFPQSTPRITTTTLKTPKSLASTHNQGVEVHISPGVSQTTPFLPIEPHTKPTVTATGVSNDAVTRPVIQFAPIIQTTPSVSIIPHDPDETLASESGHVVKVHVSSKQTDPDDVRSARVTVLAHDDKSVSTTQRVTTPASTPGRISEVPLPKSTTVSTTKHVTTPVSTPGHVSEVPLPKSTTVSTTKHVTTPVSTPGHVSEVPLPKSTTVSTTKHVTTPVSTPGHVSEVPLPKSTTVSTTKHVTTPVSTPGHVSEVPLPKSTTVVSEDDIKQVLTTPHVPIIPHDSDETLANGNGHGVKVHNTPSDVTTTTTEGIIRRLIILPRESQTTPQIVPVDDEETLAIEHGRRVQVRVDPKYKVSEMPEMGGGVGVTPSPRGGEWEWMPVDRRGGVDSEKGCKLTFTSNRMDHVHVQIARN